VARYSFTLGYLLGAQKALADASLQPKSDGFLEDLADQAYRQYLKSPQYERHIVKP
jgi:hypothetical protein